MFVLGVLVSLLARAHALSACTRPENRVVPITLGGGDAQTSVHVGGDVDPVAAAEETCIRASLTEPDCARLRASLLRLHLEVVCGGIDLALPKGAPRPPPTVVRLTEAAFRNGAVSPGDGVTVHVDEGGLPVASEHHHGHETASQSFAWSQPLARDLALTLEFHAIPAAVDDVHVEGARGAATALLRMLQDGRRAGLVRLAMGAARAEEGRGALDLMTARGCTSRLEGHDAVLVVSCHGGEGRGLVGGDQGGETARVGEVAVESAAAAAAVWDSRPAGAESEVRGRSEAELSEARRQGFVVWRECDGDVVCVIRGARGDVDRLAGALRMGAMGPEEVALATSLSTWEMDSVADAHLRRAMIGMAARGFDPYPVVAEAWRLARLAPPELVQRLVMAMADGPPSLPVLLRASAALHAYAAPAPSSQPHGSAAGASAPESRAGIHLIVQYYAASDAARQGDVEEALARNVAHPDLGAVHLLLERESERGAARAALAKRGVTGLEGRLQERVIGRRLRFRDAIDYANLRLSGESVIIANADIAFDHTLERARALPEGESWALLRWEREALRREDARSAATPVLVPRVDSQDAWVVRPPLASQVVRAADFELGGLGADNRMATVLRVHGKLRVRNACHRVRAIHIDHQVFRGGIEALRALTRYEGLNGSNYASADCCDYVGIEV